MRASEIFGEEGWRALHRSAKSSKLHDLLREDDMPIKPDEPDAASSKDTKPRRVFRELEVVRLVRPFKSLAGVIPPGTEATILQVFAGGSAYQVEFEGPYDSPETLPANLVEANAS
jgi:hypothetical protein